MFRDMIRRMEAIDITGLQHEETLKTAFTRLVPLIENSLMIDFLGAAERAMNEIPEYNNPSAKPLRDNLLRNLAAPDSRGYVHIKVQPDGNVKIFNETFAGTSSDFRAAKHHSRNNNKELKRILWKYGIYKPDVEGDISRTRSSWLRGMIENLPSYAEIIEERLDVWQGKAPYWYFIENGLHGNGMAYPTFAGTGFIRQFRLDAAVAVREKFREISRVWTRHVAEAMRIAAQTGRPMPPARDDIIWIESRTSSGSITWQPYSRSIGGLVSGRTSINPNG